MEIKKDTLHTYMETFYEDRANAIAQNAAMTNGVGKAAIKKQLEGEVPHTYSISLKQGAPCNQKRSGRCWMFAALNTFRYEIIKKNNLENFELSQNYPLFYDKLEKSHYFLQAIAKTFDEEQDSRLLKHILKDPIGDGGQWDMFINLIRKYGVVPKYAMPECANSENTIAMDQYLTKLLRDQACKLRKANKEGKKEEEIQKMIEGFMKEVYNLLAVSLGTPPEKFDFSVRDKENKLIFEKDLTPTEFFDKYVGLDIDNYISIINAPTIDKPYHHTYTVDFLGNVTEGKEVKYLNLPIDEMKKAAIKQMEDGHPVWFGCDVGQFFARESSYLDLEALDVEKLFDVKFEMTKAERLDYSESLMTHAMVFTGVDLDENNKPVKWRVENSWGKDAGKDGYLLMTDRWFDEYMYQIAIDKKYLSEGLQKEWEEEPTHLKPWDPMGSLAK